MITEQEFCKLSKKEQTKQKTELLKMIKEGVSNSKEMTEALKLIRPSIFGIRRSGRVVNAKYLIFSRLFPKVGDSVEEYTIFRELKWGRSDCRSAIQDIIKKAEADNKKWIILDTKKEAYICMGIGEQPPDNWKGYLAPKKIEVDTVEII